ncbi:MAG: hypothetical protein CMJ83_03055 [Planctomycetes bacterium]|nr:hypothetical protein [Planctomycetota bacterium]
MHRVLTLVSLTVIILVLGSAVGAQQVATQTLPPGLVGGVGGSASSWPFNATADHKWQWVFDTSLFAFQAPIVVQELSIRLSSPTATSAGGTFSNVTVTLASSPNDYRLNAAPPAGQDPVFANNLGGDASVVRTGPWVSGPVAAGSWIPLGITPGFTYDPSAGLDFVIQIEKCGTVSTFGSTFDMVTGPSGTVFANRYGHLTDCAATMRNNSANEAVLVVKLDYTAAPVTWQVNQPAATLVLDGGTGGGFGPITATRPVGQPAPLAATSTEVGSGFDAAFSLLPGVPLGGGALFTGGGQIVNLDLTDPSLLFIFNLGFNIPFTPATVNWSLPVPGTTSAQLVVLDPSQADGFALSALNTLVVL